MISGLQGTKNIQTNKLDLEPGRMSLFILYLTQPKELFSNKLLPPGLRMLK